jgi:hypothetical protein
MPEVIVLHASLPGHLGADRAAALLECLPYARRLQLERRDDAARTASLLGLELLCEGVSRLRGAALEAASLRFPAAGKPHLVGGPWFSISHSATRVAAALSDACELGIDVEDLGAVRGERAVLERWTTIEATLKAIGVGVRQAHEVRLSADLATAQLAEQVVYTRSVELSPRCVARIATRQPVGQVVVEERGCRAADGG